MSQNTDLPIMPGTFPQDNDGASKYSANAADTALSAHGDTASVTSSTEGAPTPSATTETVRNSLWTPSGVSATDGDGPYAERVDTRAAARDFPIDPRPVLAASKDLASFTKGIVLTNLSGRSFPEVAKRYFQLKSGGTVFDQSTKEGPVNDARYKLAVSALHGLKSFLLDVQSNTSNLNARNRAEYCLKALGPLATSEMKADASLRSALKLDQGNVKALPSLMETALQVGNLACHTLLTKEKPWAPTSSEGVVTYTDQRETWAVFFCMPIVALETISGSREALDTIAGRFGAPHATSHHLWKTWKGLNELSSGKCGIKFSFNRVNRPFYTRFPRAKETDETPEVFASKNAVFDWTSMLMHPADSAEGAQEIAEL